MKKFYEEERLKNLNIIDSLKEKIYTLKNKENNILADANKV